MTEEVLTMSPLEVAKALGIGRRQVYAAVKDGRLSCLRAGKKLRVPRRAVDELLANPERFNVDGEQGEQP